MTAECASTVPESSRNYIMQVPEMRLGKTLVERLVHNRGEVSLMGSGLQLLKTSVKALGGLHAVEPT